MARTPVHLGAHLAEEWRELGIRADTAFRVGRWVGTTPPFWMNLQQFYEVRLAKSEIGANIAALLRRAGKPSSRKPRKSA